MQSPVPEMNYPFAGQDTPQGDIEYSHIVSYLHLNSSDRDVVAYPSVSEYRIDSEEKFRNISSIELVASSIANQGSPLSNPYMVLRIDGLNHINFSNRNTNSGFAVMYLKQTTGPHVYSELGVLQRNVLNFKTPLASLSSIKLSIVGPDGSLFNFGEPSGDVTPAFSNSFMLRIVTLEKSFKSLNKRAVF